MPERTGFPSGSVRLVEPFGAGGGPDLLARKLAARLSAIWGRPVVVENVPGGGSTAAPALVAESRPMATPCSSTPAPTPISGPCPRTSLRPVERIQPRSATDRAGLRFRDGSGLGHRHSARPEGRGRGSPWRTHLRVDRSRYGKPPGGRTSQPGGRPDRRAPPDHFVLWRT